MTFDTINIIFKHMVNHQLSFETLTFVTFEKHAVTITFTVLVSCLKEEKENQN